MHQLTIDHRSRPVSISAHPTFDDAYHALLRYVRSADYYLWHVRKGAAHTSYQLLRLADIDDTARAPHITGIAVIKELPGAGAAEAHCALIRARVNTP